MYDADYIRRFYDAYGVSEWLRFEDSAYGRLQATIHSEFLSRHIRENQRVLDVGCGPGRFSILMAEQGAQVALLDISAGQLMLARENLAKAGKLGHVLDFVEDDITNLSKRIEPTFDVVVCFGGVLAYAYDRKQAAVDVLIRLCNPGGLILVSVPSRFGVAATVVRRAAKDVLDRPEEMHLWGMVNEGDLPGWRSKRIDFDHPPMHLYSTEELGQIFKSCDILEMVGCPVTAFEGQDSPDDLASDPMRWAHLLELERRLGRVPGLVDSGTYMLAAFRRV